MLGDIVITKSVGPGLGFFLQKDFFIDKFLTIGSHSEISIVSHFIKSTKKKKKKTSVEMLFKRKQILNT